MMTNQQLAIYWSGFVRRFGRKPQCSICGYRGWWAMTTMRGHIVCYECNLIVQRKKPYERHHIFGRENDSATTVRALANLHRLITLLHNVAGYDMFRTAAGLAYLVLFQLCECCLRREMIETRSRLRICHQFRKW